VGSAEPVHGDVAVVFGRSLGRGRRSPTIGVVEPEGLGEVVAGTHAPVAPESAPTRGPSCPHARHDR
jgi:hypothetical protein